MDPAVYPFYDQVLALDPPDAPLVKLLVNADDIVVSKNLADRANVAIGDQLRFMRHQTVYTVR